MIYPDNQLQEWIDRHKLMVVNYHCPKCQNDFPTNVPVLLRDSAGLQSRIHECGRDFAKLVLVPRTGSAKRLWKQVFGENEEER